MRTICITVSGLYGAPGGVLGDAPPAASRTLERTRAHFAERGVNAQFFHGFNAQALGLRTINPYEVDGGPGCGFNMGPKPTGIWLSHRAVWAACLLMPPEHFNETADEDEFLILEDDAKFEPDWLMSLSQAAIEIEKLPWNVLFLGSCCTEGKVKSHIRGQVYEVKWPMCLQAYLVKRKALKAMITSQDEATCYGPIDITLMFHTWEKLGGVYAILPRIVHQWDTEIPE